MNAVIKNENQTSWIIWRQELETQYISLSDDEISAFDLISRGKTFSDMCEKLCDFVSEKEAGLRAATLLKS